ncbi:MAG: GFA family protein [Acidobacteriota bacterium]
MTAEGKTLDGSCQCGKVGYRVTGEPDYMAHCHCIDCRKMHGAAFATYVGVPRSGFTWVSGEDQLTTFKVESGTIRGFCRTCGSILASWTEGEPGNIYITAGTLDSPIAKRPENHIWVRSRAPWFEIRDGLPQKEKY